MNRALCGEGGGEKGASLDLQNDSEHPKAGCPLR